MILGMKAQINREMKVETNVPRNLWSKAFHFHRKKQEDEVYNSMNESVVTRSLYEALSRWNLKRNYNKKKTFSIRPSVLVSSRISFNFLNNKNKKKRKKKKKNISDENVYWLLSGFGNNSDKNAAI